MLFSYQINCNDMKKEAKFWKSIDGNKIECSLCHQNCTIKNNQHGVCGVRKNEEGKLYTMIYGASSSIAVDPIEKKPLYHFHPCSNALSLGAVGCNFKCMHCQNSSISRATPDFPYMQEVKPEQVVNLAKKRGCEGIAWTYNEPTIWHEFTYDASKLAKKEGLYTVYVSNGYINEEPFREISQYLDAINVDIKAFTDDFYKKICKSHLMPVLETCVLAMELNVHLEVTYLIIPGYNDSPNEIKKFCDWVVEKLDRNVPVHFSRFHPDYEMLNVPSTPIDTMLNAYKIAHDLGILYPYLGNVTHGEYENTICPKCGNICINRHNYSVNLDGLKNDRCIRCGSIIPIVK